MFSHLIGNAPAASILAHKNLPPVLLLQGPDGVGKGLFAEAAGRKLLATFKAQPPDLHIYKPENDHHPVETIRQMIAEIGMPPFEAPYKVFIIHDADKMLPASSNTLLKTLEEPPDDTYIFLLSAQPERLLPTIVSRCHKIVFFPIPDDVIAAYLMEKYQISLEEARKASFLSDGSLARALYLVSDRPRFPVQEFFLAKSYTDLLHALAKLDEDEEADVLFEDMLFWVREHRPFELEKMLALIAEARTALAHHIKLKNVIEHIIVRFEYNRAL